MRQSRTLPLISLLACLTTMAAPAIAGEATSRPAHEEGDRSDILFFELKYADPAQVAQVIQKAIGEVVCVPVETANSLIVTASHRRAKEAESLIARLDTPNPAVSVRVLPLTYARAEEVTKTLLAVLPKTRVTFDRPTNSVLVDATSASPVQELIAKLDGPTSGASQKNYSLRVVWLLSEGSLPAPPPDMKETLQELAAIGIENMHVAAQLMTVAHGKFSIDSSPATFTDCHLKIDGTLLESPRELPSLDLTLSVVGRLKDDEDTPRPTPMPGQPRPGMPGGWFPELASFKTTLSVPPGKKIILGMGPIGQFTSVFVVQLVESPGSQAAGPERAAPPAPR